MDGAIVALEMNYDEWLELCTEKLGLQRYRTDQLCQWIYQKKVFNIYDMTNLGKDLREDLSYKLLVLPPTLVRHETSKDGTRKFLWQLQDGQKIESVLLSHGNHNTACISSQVGCPLRCTFCATGMSGFVRDLTAGEIVGQFLAMEKVAGQNITNIVFMGMGEPLLNQEALFKSIKILNHPKMRGLGARHITVSTSGIVPGIRAMAELDIPVRLSVSLHATNDTLRNKLMPVNQKYSLGSLIEALRYYQEKTGDRITIEYVMIDKVNDSSEQAYELAALTNNLSIYVNLIPYNPVDSRYKRSTPERIKAFGSILKELNIEYEIRREKGSDINAACGQLRRRDESDSKSKS
ncbi:putative dual-specificity RNA methyltransferase RlmN [bioreactor metagenome]|uniref:Putative dual-specificity RNA methyltransferase RlmN n=1 Tax=bioreactor metagenome TaxID=1076179 RepID=A0A645BM70_9ZZZZ|nr:23S rRNA (adenine(2503)-C(2))-methyltransferase RlmN [Aminobacterium sp.]MEA4877804.1 23S rRNA (adenine(2503)-C(2))-methyltransferase RlmN [Aminobacterium sp.]